jgi:hypothetical protein
MFWERYKVDENRKENGDDHISNQNYPVEGNDMNKTTSWINFFAISLSNP